MEVENHHDSLPRFDVLQPFEVSPINDNGALHIRDGPMPGNLFSIGVHRTYRFHFNAQFHFLPLLLPASSASSAMSSSPVLFIYTGIPLPTAPRYLTYFNFNT